MACSVNRQIFFAAISKRFSPPSNCPLTYFDDRGAATIFRTLGSRRGGLTGCNPRLENRCDIDF